jgi:hypothetical protein
MTDRHWTLRQELYIAFHRWPVIVACLLLGSLVGGVISLALPSYFKAIAQVYVGLNPYRAFSDARFLAVARPKYSNIDDYKDWQMSQLESAIYLDEFMQATLENLRAADPYWQDFNVDELSSLLEADWRSAGTWSLIAKHPDPTRATQAVTAWSDVVMQRVNEAIDSAREAIRVDQELQSVADERVALSLQRRELQSTTANLNKWKERITELPSGSSLDRIARWEILSQIARVAQFNPAWSIILESEPTPESQSKDYTEWIDAATLLINEDRAAIQEQLSSLDGRKTTLEEDFQAASEASLGLSPNLEVESIERLDPERVRPTRTLVLIGGLVGLLAWVWLSLARIRQGKPEQ